MKKKWIWLFCVAIIYVMFVFKPQTVYAEEEEYISGEGVNRALFDVGTASDAESDEELETLYVGAGPEVRVDGYLTYSEAVEYMRSQMVARKSGFQLKFAMANDLNMDGVYEAFLKDVCAETDSPVEGDYLLLHYRNYGYTGSRSVKSGVYAYTLNVTFKYMSTAEEERALDDEVERILKQLNLSQDNEYQKVKKIYDYITSNVTYDYGAAYMLSEIEALQSSYPNMTNSEINQYYDAMVKKYPNAWSAYGAAVKKKCVCQGYANLFYRLAREAGLSVRSIRGTSFSGGHAWNIVRIGRYYYNVDSTWDSEETTYSYFLKSTSAFDNHTRNSEYSTSRFQSLYPIDPYSFNKSSYDPNAYVTSVKMAQGEKITMRIGSRRQFSAKAYPEAVANKNLNWTSSDTSIAIVDSTGKVTIKRVGSVVITATSANNPLVYDTCLVTVTDTGWVDYDGTWSYIVSGYKITGWKKFGNDWYYFDSNGKMKTGWVKSNGQWYYMLEDGHMKIGWVYYQGDWYYTRADGSMATGWVKIKDCWYYFNDYGIMRTGWVKSNGQWYYMLEDGHMKTGWLQYNGNWYFLTADGSMKTGWYKCVDDWYYFDSNGIMVTGDYEIDSVVYHFTKIGNWVP